MSHNATSVPRKYGDLITNPVAVARWIEEHAAEPDPLIDTDDWKMLGSCRETDPEAFFPEKGGSTKAAKKTCSACPVKNECLLNALQADERFGVWGGRSERERRALDRKYGGRGCGAEHLEATLIADILRMTGAGWGDEEITAAMMVSNEFLTRTRARARAQAEARARAEAAEHEGPGRAA